jgi:hypothetical protein
MDPIVFSQFNMLAMQFQSIQGIKDGRLALLKLHTKYFYYHVAGKPTMFLEPVLESLPRLHTFLATHTGVPLAVLHLLASFQQPTVASSLPSAPSMRQVLIQLYVCISAANLANLCLFGATLLHLEVNISSIPPDEQDFALHLMDHPPIVHLHILGLGVSSLCSSDQAEALRGFQRLIALQSSFADGVKLPMHVLKLVAPGPKQRPSSMFEICCACYPR